MRPITLGLQEDCPLYLSHSPGLFDPTELQLQTEKQMKQLVVRYIAIHSTNCLVPTWSVATTSLEFSELYRISLLHSCGKFNEISILPLLSEL